MIFIIHQWNKNEKDIERLANTQKKLLDKAMSKLSDKGILIYCNCSMQFEEGEKVIDFFIKKNRVKLLPIKHEELKLFPKEIFKSGFIRTLPYMYNEFGGLDGFFIARFIIWRMILFEVLKLLGLKESILKAMDGIFCIAPSRAAATVPE